MDSSDAYEIRAREFLEARDQSAIGTDVVKRWAQSLANHAGVNASANVTSKVTVLEIGCGGGYPITSVLRSAGLHVQAIDSSPTLVAEFKTRFPDIPVECARVQESGFFDQSFNAAIAIGLVFLLSESDQTLLFTRIANSLLAGGRFLFTAPIETGQWIDTNTGISCQSLGRAVYERELASAGFRIVDTYIDEGANNYYDTELIK